MIGILLYVLLFYYSTTLYPGGSQANPNSIGYDWIHNYWCNLLNDYAINKQANPGKNYAVVAMFVLCTAILTFFINFALNFCKSIFWKQTIILSGILSMLFAFLISTNYHDLMTILSSIFGLFALIGILVELYGSKLNCYKLTAVCCVILLALNNYVYYSKHFLIALPLLQKVTIAFVLSWIGFLNYRISKLR